MSDKIGLWGRVDTHQCVEFNELALVDVNTQSISAPLSLFNFMENQATQMNI